MRSWFSLAGKRRSRRYAQDQGVENRREQNQADPLSRVTGPRMNPSVDVGRSPRPFRHLRMAERRSPDPSSSRAPVHSALVQKSVTRHHQHSRPAFIWMLGKFRVLGKPGTVKRWKMVCYPVPTFVRKDLTNRAGATTVEDSASSEGMSAGKVAKHSPSHRNLG